MSKYVIEKLTRTGSDRLNQQDEYWLVEEIPVDDDGKLYQTIFEIGDYIQVDADEGERYCDYAPLRIRQVGDEQNYLKGDMVGYKMGKVKALFHPEADSDFGMSYIRYDEHYYRVMIKGLNPDNLDELRFVNLTGDYNPSNLESILLAVSNHLRTPEFVSEENKTNWRNIICVIYDDFFPDEQPVRYELEPVVAYKLVPARKR